MGERAARAAKDTICAVATPRGDGAIGVVRLSGPRALSWLRAVSGRVGFEARRVSLVEIADPASGETIDRALVCWMPGPRSYTGEDLVEVYGHGGALNMARLLELFASLGARQAAPGEFTRRAFLNGRIDLSQAEAVAEVVSARSEAALRNAQAMLGGALGERIGAARGRIVELAAVLEASIDFAEETELAPSARELAARHEEAISELEELAGSYERGRRLGGITVALVGPVNSGKSTLFNALLGRERAIVSAEEGTTRDYLEEEASWEGRRVRLVDTAGERAAGELQPLEREGRRLAGERIGSCDIVVRVVDAAVGGGTRGDAQLLALNKSDLLGAEALEEARARCSAEHGALLLSALEGSGVEELREALVAFHGEEGGEEVQVTQQRQWNALRRAADALVEGKRAALEGSAPELVVEHAKAALEALEEITGERYTEEVLDAVFSRFCIGK